MPDQPAYECNPEWHDGHKAGADFLIRLPGAKKHPNGLPTQYACCNLHLGRAIRYLKWTRAHYLGKHLNNFRIIDVGPKDEE